MSAKKSPVGIKTAKREEKNGGAFFLDLDTVEAWINSLPRGSAGKTAQHLFSSLSDTNKIKLDFEDRLDYLELIREPLFYTMSVMEKHFIGVNFPLSNKQKKIASLSKEFCLLMMTGYVIAIEELLEDYKERRDKKSLAMLIHRAISYLNHFLRVSYQTYMIVPDDIWDKFHKLYLFAEKYNVSKLEISDEHFQYINKTSILEEYIRSLLLASASPYHMRSNEVGNTYINIERWMNSVRILPVTDTIKAKYYFITDISSKLPVLGEQELKGRRKNNLRVVVIDELINKINHELQSSEVISSQTLLNANLGDATLSHDLLRRLKYHWTSRPEPVVDRSRSIQKLKMVIGISATYNLARETVGQGTNDSQLFNNLADFDNMQVSDVQPKQNDVKANNELKNTTNKTENNGEEWLLSNEKKSEFCLQRSGDCAQQLQVGEVVGLKHTSGNKKNRFMLGIISWLRVYGDSLIKVGIKSVSTSAVGIELNTMIDSVKSGHCQRAFLIPMKKETGQPGSIFGLPLSFRSGAAVMVSVYGKEIPVKLTHKLIDSGLYSQYQFEAVKKKIARKKKKTQARRKSTATGTGFDDVWDTI